MEPKPPIERGLRAAIAMTGARHAHTLHNLLAWAAWLGVFGALASGCDSCVPSWGPTAPPESEAEAEVLR